MTKHENSNIDPDDDTLVSRSQRKRDAHEVLDLAKSLVEMGDKLFAGLRLPEQIRDATALARSITAYGGRKRQIQYMAKLMRNADLDDLRAQLRSIEEHAEISKKRHKQLELWRDRLINEGDAALGDLLAQWPNADRQSLRQLVRNARREQEKQSAPKSARALFQYLKTL